MIGIASLVLSIFSGLLTIVMFVAAGILGARNPEALDDDGPAAIVLGLGIIAFMFGSLIAIGLGVGNLFESHRTKIFGILGLTFGAISFLGTLALLLLGMMMQ
jgi:ABC-type microcin C transport system permease subunit YejB